MLAAAYRLKLPQTFDVASALTALAVVVAGWLIYRVGRMVIRRAATPKFVFREESSRQADTARALLLSVWKYLMVFVILAALVALLPSALVPTIAMTTVVGLVVAFGAQTLVKDILAGFSIVLEGQFAVGDRVQIFGVECEGTVEAIGLRVSVIRDDDGARIFVPNGSITAVRNISMAPPGASTDRSRTRGGRGGRARTTEVSAGRSPVRRSEDDRPARGRTSDDDRPSRGRGDGDARRGESETRRIEAADTRREPQQTRRPEHPEPRRAISADADAPARSAPSPARRSEPAAVSDAAPALLSDTTGSSDNDSTDSGEDSATLRTSTATGQRRTRRGGRGRGGRGSGGVRPAGSTGESETAAAESEGPVSGWPIQAPDSDAARTSEPAAPRHPAPSRAASAPEEKPQPRPEPKPAPVQDAPPAAQPASAPAMETPRPGRPFEAPRAAPEPSKSDDRGMDDSPWSIE